MESNFLKSISILIVDDNESDLEIIDKSISRYFKEVHTASNGVDAFEIYKNNKNIDIIISDISNSNPLILGILMSDIITKILIL